MISLGLMWVLVAISTAGAVIFSIGMAWYTDHKNRNKPLLIPVIIWIVGIIVTLGPIVLMVLSNYGLALVKNR